MPTWLLAVLKECIVYSIIMKAKPLIKKKKKNTLRNNKKVSLQAVCTEEGLTSYHSLKIYPFQLLSRRGQQKAASSTQYPSSRCLLSHPLGRAPIVFERKSKTFWACFLSQMIRKLKMWDASWSSPLMQWRCCSTR